MALTERTIIDQIEVAGEFRHIQIREATIIERDGSEISRAYHRRVIAPGEDVSSEDEEIKRIAESVHTTEIIAAYEGRNDG